MNEFEQLVARKRYTLLLCY